VPPVAGLALVAVASSSDPLGSADASAKHETKSLIRHGVATGLIYWPVIISWLPAIAYVVLVPRSRDIDSGHHRRRHSTADERCRAGCCCVCSLMAASLRATKHRENRPYGTPRR
jgi:hypothetical protein